MPAASPAPPAATPLRRPLPPLWTREFVLLVCGHFLQALGFAAMLLLPLYLEHLGANRERIGFLMALSAAGGLASRPLAGWALDAWGRKPTLVVGTCLLATSLGLFHWIRELDWLIYFDRVLLGVGAGTLFTGYFTWASDVIPVERRTEGIALFGISGLLPIGLNAVVGELRLEPDQLRSLFVGISLLITLSLGALLALEEPARPSSEGDALGVESGVGWRGALRTLIAPGLWPVWLATGVFAALVGIFFSFATVSAEARGVSAPALLWLAYAGGAVGVRLVGSRLPDRLGPRNLVAPALGLYVLAMVTCAGAETQRGFVGAGLLAGLAHGYCFPVLLSQVVTRTAARWRGTALAGFTALWQLAEFVFPPRFGWVADTYGDPAMYHLAAASSVIGLTAWALCELWVSRRSPPKPAAPLARAEHSSTGDTKADSARA